MKAYTEIRSQHAKGTWPKQGPDTYVAVQVVPDNTKRLVCLNQKVAKKRGIKIIYCGEGYSMRQQTSRSMLNQAKEKAYRLTDEINHLVQQQDMISAQLDELIN